MSDDLCTPFVEEFQRVLRDEGRRQGKRWTFYCPFVGCKDYETRKLYVDPENGNWCCFHCCYTVPGKTYRDNARIQHGGSWREFAQLMGDDPCQWPQARIFVEGKQGLPLGQAQVIWTEWIGRLSLQKDHAEQLHQRCIDPEQARYVSVDYPEWKKYTGTLGPDLAIASGLGFIPERGSSKGKLIPTLCTKPGRMLIPYWVGAQVIYFVGYQKCPPDWDNEYGGKWVKITNISGFTPPLYGPIPWRAPYLIVTEGQLKTEAANQAGFPCVGLPGVGIGHAQLAMQAAAKKVERLIIGFDTEADLKIAERVDTHALTLASECVNRNIPTFRIRLPLDPQVEGGRKMDIDGFLASHGVSAFMEVLKTAGQERYVLEAPESQEVEYDDTRTG